MENFRMKIKIQIRVQKKQNQRQILGLLLLWFFIGISQADNVKRLGLESPQSISNLREALDLALQSSPAIKSAKHSHEAIINHSSQLQAFHNPEIEIEFDNLGSTHYSNNDEGIQTTIKLGKKFTPPLLYSKIATQAKINTFISYLQLKLTLQKVLRQVRQNYLELWAAKQNLKLQQENAKLSEEAHRIARERVLQGDLPSVDSLRTEIKRVEALMNFEESTHILDFSQSELEALWGAHVRVNLDELKAPERPAFNEPTTIDWTSKLEESPTWKLVETLVKQSENKVKIERSHRIPEFTLSGGIKTLQNEEGRTIMASVSLPLPLLNWNNSAVAAALSEEKAQDFNAQQEYLAQKQRLKHMLKRFELSRERFQRSENQLLPATRIALESTLKGYEVGKYSGESVLQAKLDWLNSEQSFIENTKQYYESYYDLLELTETLKEIKGIDNE
jgi:cobalt-zinc-cadmium efflux system outer membrane protein